MDVFLWAPFTVCQGDVLTVVIVHHFELTCICALNGSPEGGGEGGRGTGSNVLHVYSWVFIYHHFCLCLQLHIDIKILSSVNVKILKTPNMRQVATRVFPKGPKRFEIFSKLVVVSFNDLIITLKKQIKSWPPTVRPYIHLCPNKDHIDLICFHGWNIVLNQLWKMKCICFELNGLNRQYKFASLVP